jgi:hypothetical protein
MKASPAEAHIFLDGTPIATNPATARRPRDGAIHLIRFEAPGFEPREESLGFDRSVYLNIELHPLGGNLPTATTVPGTSGGAPDTPAPRPRGRRDHDDRPKAPRPRPSAGKAIDSENPY